MTEADESITNVKENNTSNYVLFLIAALAVVAIASLAVVHMPDQFKKIFLLSVAYCVIVAVALRSIASNLQLSESKWLTASLFVSLIAGQTLIAWQSYQILLSDRKAALKDEPLAELALEIAKSEESDSDHSRQLRETMSPGFLYYLRYRLSTVVKLEQPWPAIIWGIEILVAASIGVVVGKQIVTLGGRTEQSTEPVA